MLAGCWLAGGRAVVQVCFSSGAENIHGGAMNYG
jgi:hypothetical protein|eukprot:COSAG02_NODE_10525_length_1921_cov_1.108612_2_plen_34_part_00